MNVQKFIAAAVVFIAAGSAVAADAPVAVSAAAVVAASNLNLPTVSITSGSGQSRAAVQAEAVEFVKHYKTAFAVQLEQYKN
ncbi:MAG: hypothetical protein QFF03_18065 [Pseudomonadota bacterium]|nr:hypothetical protein [Pseudomonadota bacterium]